jgi:hypothetical protein
MAKQLVTYIQGVKYEVKCCVCGEPVTTKRFNIDGMNYACSEKCYEEEVD